VEQNLQETNYSNGRLSSLNVRVVFIFRLRMNVRLVFIFHFSSAYHKHVLFPEFVDIRMDDQEHPMFVI
jgi:hypothetical protein